VRICNGYVILKKIAKIVIALINLVVGKDTVVNVLVTIGEIKNCLPVFSRKI
jgi:hypothetical protein